MSEQPFTYQIQNPDKEGTVFDDANGTQIDLRTNQTVPNYDQRVVDAGRKMFQKSNHVEIERPHLSEVAVRGVKLAKLNEVRNGLKLLEQTDFLKETGYEEAA